MPTLDASFWNNRYLNDQTGWNIGYPSPPLKAYFDQLTDKSLKILIPGAGNAYEAEYLHQQGFSEVYILDWAVEALQNFKTRVPDFPDKHLVQADFFSYKEQFDRIIEQTFFCALPPERRADYVQKMTELLKPNGKLVGLLFNASLNTDRPPFGGNEKEYRQLLEPHLNILTLQTATNSIKPRQRSEFFFIAQRPVN